MMQIDAATIALVACVVIWALYEAAHAAAQSWRKARRVIREAQQHPDQAGSRQPGPGPCPVPGRSVPPSDTQAGPGRLHAPAPALAPGEADFLDTVQLLRAVAQPGHTMAGREIADGLRVRFGTVDDWTLGLITLDLLGYIEALWFGLPDKEHAVRCVMDAFSLCAEELTRLARNDGVVR